MFWVSSLCLLGSFSDPSPSCFWTLGGWLIKVETLSSFPSGFLSRLADGRQEELEVGVFVLLVPSPPSCYGCLQPTHGGHCPGPSNRALCLCLRAGLGWKGSLLLWVSVEGCTVPYYIFLNPTHTFVNIPFVRFTSIYPIWVYHLFPARILTNRMSSSL